ncbi:MAG: hypothetical protein V3U69_05380 [Bacteroidota bacterium]
MIDSLVVVPDADAIGLPAPVWFLKTLLNVTFILHIIPMNFALGGGFIAAVSHFIGRKTGHAHHLMLSRSLSRMLPIAIAFTITLGVAPLLFLQVLYGQYFYTSSILLAWPWLTVIVLLILSYYGFYLYSFRWESLADRQLRVVLTSAILFAVIGFIFSNNMVLMLTPERWMSVYQESPHGVYLDLKDPMLFPRFLHFLVGSFAIAGLLVLIIGMGKLKSEPDYGLWAIRHGIRWFLFPTLLQLGVGTWFLRSIRHDVMLQFMGGDQAATAYLVVGLSFVMITIVLMFLALNSDRPKGLAYAGICTTAVVLVMMSLMRDFVRDAYLKPYFDASEFSVQPQTAVVTLFLALLVISLGVVAWMVRKAWLATHPAQ